MLLTHKSDGSYEVSDTFAYDAFGQLLDETGGEITPEGDIATSETPQTNYLYTGQQFDASRNLYSLRACTYDPAQGRFLSRDPYPYQYSNPFELNRYVYTANDPVNLTDPSGLATSLEQNAIYKMVVGAALILGKTFAGITIHVVAAGIFLFMAYLWYLNLRHGIEEMRELAEPDITAPDTPDAGEEAADPFERAIDQIDFNNPIGSISGSDPNPTPPPGNETDPNPRPIPVPVPTPTPRNNPGRCEAPNGETSGTIGVRAHQQIQRYFQTRFEPSAEIEYSIPGSAASGGTGFADAVLLDEGARSSSGNFAGIYEIKPIQHKNIPSALQAAREQRDRYVDNFARFC